MDEDTVVRVRGIAATIRRFVRMGWVEEVGNGQYLTTGPHPRVPFEEPPPASPKATEVDPYSLRGLQMRGYYVMAGKTHDEDRVMIGGGYFRITEARKHGLI